VRGVAREQEHLPLPDDNVPEAARLVHPQAHLPLELVEPLLHNTGCLNAICLHMGLTSVWLMWKSLRRLGPPTAITMKSSPE
jgi:hypothetical protein